MENNKFLAERTSETHTLRLAESSEAVQNGAALCSLEGPFADSNKPTRNGRRYKAELWNRIINSAHVKEMLETKTFFGEADHPTAKEERLEVSLPKVSHVVTDMWLNKDDGIVYGKLDILDTPSGRILKTMIDYGSVLGISSRGSGRVIEQSGEPVVDSKTYAFVTFDIVPLPANVSSRLNQPGTVNESTEQNGMLDAIRNEVEASISKQDVEELSAIQGVLESINLPELQPLCEQVNTALNGTNVDSEQDDLEEAYETITNLRGQISTLEATVRDLESSRSNQESNTITLPNEKVLENLDNNFADMMAKLNELQSVVSNKPSMSDEEVNELRSELDEQVQEVARLTKEVDRHNDLVESVKNELGIVNGNLQEAKTELLENKELIKTFEEQVDVLSTEADKVPNLEESISQLKAELTTAENEAIELNDQLGDRDSEIESLRESIAKKNERFAKLQEQLSEKDDEVSLVSEKLNEFTEAYVKLRANQLGVNPNVALRSISEAFSPDEVEETLKEMASSRVKQSKMSYSPSRVKTLSESSNLNESSPIVVKKDVPNGNKMQSLVSIVKGARTQ